MLSPEQQKLQALMQQIKGLLKQHDIAAAVVLAMPKQEAESNEFVTLKYDHVETSYSYAKTYRHHCCPQHGEVDGIALHAAIAPGDEEGTNKLLQTVNMFAAMGKGVQHCGRMYERVLKEISGMLRATKNESVATRPINMN